jgi:hypothetical protein
MIGRSEYGDVNIVGANTVYVELWLVTVINEEKRDMRMKCKFNLNLYYMPQIFHPISYCNFSGLS